jgi:hypothetical protein
LSWLLSKPVITPITAALFILVSLTGILLLLHVESRTVKETHELVGVLFVAGALVHLAMNWRCFASYVRRPATVALGVGTSVLIAFLLLGTGDGGEGREGGGRPMNVFRLLETAPLAHVAPLLGMEAKEVAEALRQQGLSVVDEEQTIGDIARSNGRQVPEILGVFQAAGPEPGR